MTLKHLFTVLTIVSCTLLGFTACNDEDYAPIHLKILNGEGQLNHNTLYLNAFSAGESFLIIGGNGRYVIENKSSNIVDYRYDGHTLNIIPKGVGTATVLIKDHAGNQMTLTIEVSNPTSLFKVIDIETKAYGDNMTGGNMKQLEKEMQDESLMKIGGDLLLTYTNKEYTEGSVTIHPTPSGRPVVGTFQQEEKFSTNNVPYQEFKVTLADNRVIIWQLLNYNVETGKEMLLQEDMTEVYIHRYPTLEKATLTYTITH